MRRLISQMVQIATVNRESRCGTKILLVAVVLLLLLVVSRGIIDRDRMRLVCRWLFLDISADLILVGRNRRGEMDFSTRQRCRCPAIIVVCGSGSGSGINIVAAAIIGRRSMESQQSFFATTNAIPFSLFEDESYNSCCD